MGWLACHVWDRLQWHKDLCALSEALTSREGVEKAYSPRANASRRLFHSRSEGPALGIALIYAHYVFQCSNLCACACSNFGEIRARLSASVCLSVDDYSRTTGYEAAYERYQQL